MKKITPKSNFEDLSDEETGKNKKRPIEKEPNQPKKKKTVFFK